MCTLSRHNANAHNLCVHYVDTMQMYTTCVHTMSTQCKCTQLVCTLCRHNANLHNLCVHYVDTTQMYTTCVYTMSTQCKCTQLVCTLCRHNANVIHKEMLLMTPRLWHLQKIVIDELYQATDQQRMNRYTCELLSAATCCMR